MRKIGFISLVLAAAFAATAVFAGRLDGNFATEDEELAGANQACVEVENRDFGVDGTVIGSVTSGCIVRIEYSTPEPHKASSTALKGTKTKGSSKVSQSVFAEVDVILEDQTPASCSLDMIASSFAEKCKVDASVKSSTADSVDSSRVTVSCDLGEEGANLDVDPGPAVATPSVGQVDAVVASFDGRDDVKLSNGKLTIKHAGVPDLTAPAQPPCDVATTTSSTTTSTTGAATTSTTTTTTSTTTTTTLGA